MKNRTVLLWLKVTLFIAAYGLVSCEKIIDISIPEKERKIVVNGLISADMPARIHFSRSLSVLEKDSLVTIADAQVSLFEGDNLIGEFLKESDGYYYLPSFLPLVGHAYRLKASSTGLQPIEAEAIVPAVVPLASVDTATLTGEWGQQELRLSVKFIDPAGVRNIYGFGVEVTYKEFNYDSMSYTGKILTHPAYLYSNTDGFLEDESTDFEGKLYFEDLLFDGQPKTVEFGVTDYSFYESDTVWLNVRMEQIDPSYFLYVKSYESYREAHGNPFSEPVQVYTNVKGGYGIFSGSSSSTYKLVVIGTRKF